MAAQPATLRKLFFVLDPNVSNIDVPGAVTSLIGQYTLSDMIAFSTTNLDGSKDYIIIEVETAQDTQVVAQLHNMPSIFGVIDFHSYSFAISEGF